MKKTFIILSAAMLSLAACKKDYTCTCTSTYVNSDGDAGAGTPEITTIKDVRKSTAAQSADCVGYTQTYKEGLYSETVTRTCTLDKK